MNLLRVPANVQAKDAVLSRKNESVQSLPATYVPTIIDVESGTRGTSVAFHYFVQEKPAAQYIQYGPVQLTIGAHSDKVLIARVPDTMTHPTAALKEVVRA